MRTIPSALATARAARGGIECDTLFWITARDRTTGVAESVGLWTGEDAITVTIGGEERVYQGAGPIIAAEPIVLSVGLDVRVQKVTLSPISADVEAAVQLYDARFAPIEIHSIDRNPLTGTLIAEPVLEWRGVIDGIETTTPEIGGEATLELSLASSALALTRTLPARRNDAWQSRRGGDRFLRYADVSGTAGDWWGAVQKEGR